MKITNERKNKQQSAVIKTKLVIMVLYWPIVCCCLVLFKWPMWLMGCRVLASHLNGSNDDYETSLIRKWHDGMMQFRILSVETKVCRVLLFTIKLNVWMIGLISNCIMLIRKRLNDRFQWQQSSVYMSAVHFCIISILCGSLCEILSGSSSEVKLPINCSITTTK